MEPKKEEKQPKTWEQALSELQGFIIKSRKEEQEKAKQEQSSPKA